MTITTYRQAVEKCLIIFWENKYKSMLKEKGEHYRFFNEIEDTGYQPILVLLFALSPRNLAAISIIFDHLFALVGNMGTHSRQPLQGIKDFFGLTVS